MKKFILILLLTLSLTKLTNSQCLNIDLCWAEQYSGPGAGADRFHDIKVSQTTGNVYTTGQRYATFADGLDFITVKYDPDGNLLWERIYDGNAGEDIAHSIAIDDSDNVYVTGESKGDPGDGSDYVTIKYNSNGDTKWVNRYNGTLNAADVANSVFIDALHNVYITGSARMTGHGSDVVTIKYSSGGTQLWLSAYHFGSNDYGTKVITDNSGNVHVTGYSQGTGSTEHDYVTIKYNSSGATVAGWPKRYDGTVNAADEPRDICIDNSGNVYVTGRSRGTFAAFEFATIKYKPNGDTLWVRRYRFAGDGEEANAMCVDSSGNVFVTGESKISGNSDFVTVKYNSSGVLQSGWPKRFDGTADAIDIPRSIVSGNNGKIFVGGGSNSTGTGDDFLIVEYDAATGAECNVSRRAVDGEDNINVMCMDYTRGLLYACGETSIGAGGADGMAARYCIFGLTNAFYNINAVIEGFYNPSSNRLNMRDTLRAYLRNNTAPFSIVDSAKVILDSTSLLINCVFTNTPSGNYYIVLKHRNTIETWSRAGGENYICGDPVSYDFTNSISKAYGNNMKQVDTAPVRFAMFSGDINQEGNINLNDILLVFNNTVNFVNGYVNTDVTGDRVTNLNDILIVYNNSANFVSISRP